MPGLAGIWEAAADEGRLRQELATMTSLLQMPTVPQHAATFTAMGIACVGLARETPAAAGLIARREHGNIRLVFDGELYNRAELVASLPPNTPVGIDSDADLCLALLLEQGDVFVERLNGQFNLVVHRGDDERLSIATDRFGYRPLFVTRRGQRVVFATAIKAILAVLDRAPAIDGIGLLESMRGNWPLGNRTWLEGIDVAAPGRWLHFTRERSWESRYFQLRFERRSDRASVQSHAEGLAAKLTQAIHRQSEAGKRIAVPLSGGLDSRALLLAAPRDRPPALAYTFGRSDSFDVQLAQRIAGVAGVRHRHFAYEAGYLGTILPGVVWLNEGLTAFAQVSMGSLAFHDRIGAEADVLLYGHCGDCLTGAHLSPAIIASRSREQLIDLVYRQYNQIAEPALRRVFNENFYRRHAGGLLDALRATFSDIDGETVADIADVWDMENRQRRGTFNSTPVDRYRFEVRAPFLDNDVVDHLRRAPPSWRIQQTAYKRMLVTAFRGAEEIPWSYTGMRLSRSLSVDLAQHAVNYIRRRLPRRREDPRTFRNLTIDTRSDAQLARLLKEFCARDSFPASVFERKGIEDTIEDHWSGRHDLTHLVVMLGTFATAWRLFLLAPPAAMPADMLRFA